VKALFQTRYAVFEVLLFATVALAIAGFWEAELWWSLGLLLPLCLLGVWDLVQTRHSLMRLYPVVAHFRWLSEALRPFLRQYIVEGDLTGTPFNRHQRSLVYARAKDQVDAQPFGTQLDVYGPDYEMMTYSLGAKKISAEGMRVTIGGPQCDKPYSASLLNISAMSFGSLSGRAIEALNKGAALGNFFHDTGEGGLSRYHRKHGGDLVWEIGTGYFGCRDKDGNFDPDLFRETAQLDQVKMIEIKLSQGAKPGHGGVLPAAKVTQEIADARQVEAGQTCLSPPAHTAFSTPAEMMHFVQQLRELSGGKPVGLKMCIGHPWELFAICKAMHSTGIKIDFLVVDGAEGGTGAAPEEFSDHLGLPLRDGLIMARNALVGAGLRHDIRLGASGKVYSAFSMANNLALGADFCNAARAFMFTVGCVMTLKCHTGKCPTGVATQDPSRQRALVVEDKAKRAYNFQRHTMEHLAELVGAAGLQHPGELRPHHLYHRRGPNALATMEMIHPFLEPGVLLDDPDSTPYAEWWKIATPESFVPLRDPGPDHHRIIARG